MLQVRETQDNVISKVNRIVVSMKSNEAKIYIIDAIFYIYAPITELECNIMNCNCDENPIKSTILGTRPRTILN